MTHLLLQLDSPAGHETAHLPLAQTCPVLQLLLQLPQLDQSV